MNTGEIQSKTVQVTLLNKSTETVTVRRLLISELEKYIDLIGKEPRMIALLCGKAPEWADQLEDDSVAAIIATGRALNEARAIAWAMRTLEQNAKLKGVATRLQELGLSGVIASKN